ncbi:NADH-quinone oxidoreductase subunit NuoH [Chloroflexi bacterium CFX6]|nr:NADH-quinone oxidoreductase subunit NuoH [Chloroflexi bacterium CFX6]
MMLSDWTLWLEWFIKALVLIFALLGGFAYLTWYERRALARIQSRIGPNRAGPQGLLQPIADAVKLIFKEELVPARADKILFFWAPVITMVPSIILAAIIPWGTSFTAFGREIKLYLADINVGVLYLMSIASIAVYGIVLAGWSSNNKYAMLGGLRSSAQMISYELTLGLSFVTAILLANSMRLIDIVNAQRDMWFVVVQPVGAVIFWVATLAEVNRAPFDMPEAEQELTAGYHSEYSGMKFALFFMAEYQKMIVICMIAATLYFGGYREFSFLANTFFSVDHTWTLGSWQITNWFLGPIYLFLKVVVLLFGMIWVRATWPRIRYDRLMSFGWKILLPLSLAIAFITALGILLADASNNPIFFWAIPVLSIMAGLFTVVVIYRELRRKAYERA